MFTVIIPTYNRKVALAHGLRSVLNQTFQDFELIVVDNGSNDGTEASLAPWLLQEPRLRYIYQPNSGSPAGSRNTGIQAAQRPWVAFLDSDDVWLPKKLEQVARVITDHPPEHLVGVSHWETLVVSGVKERILKHGKWLQEASLHNYKSLLFKGNCLSTSAMVLRRDILLKLGGFNPHKDYITVEDYDLWLRAAQLGSFRFIKEPLGECHLTTDNLSSNHEVHLNHLEILITQHIEGLPTLAHTKKHLLKLHKARVQYYRGRTLQKAGHFAQAQSALWQALQQNPFTIKGWMSLGLASLGKTH